ncbi:hypothetical protein, partial [Chelativorans sp. M5D2P16]|uniref:hypothetical protein n=1 Tax=Chelativorans sp. M5D2P16 TaxID=3095678 RepID=UPI002ACA3DD1
PGGYAAAQKGIYMATDMIEKLRSPRAHRDDIHQNTRRGRNHAANAPAVLSLHSICMPCTSLNC